MITNLLRLILPLALAVTLVAQTDQANNPLIGTWKLNIAKSKLVGPTPQSGTVTMTPDGTFIFERISAEGKSYKWSHPWAVGKEVPIDGIENMTVIVTKLQGHMVDETMKSGGKAVQTVHSVVSPDGKSVTANIDFTDKQGKPMHVVEVYDKQ